MFNDGFLIRANIAVIDHRAPEHSPVLPRKLKFEVEVIPGENLYVKIRELMERVSDRTVQDVTLSSMGKRAKEIGKATDNKDSADQPSA